MVIKLNTYNYKRILNILYKNKMPKEICPTGKHWVRPYTRTTTNKAGEKHIAPVKGHCRVSAGRRGHPEEKFDHKIESLDLEPNAKRAAYILKNKYPDIKFTSGRRTRKDQAKAMASNVIKKPMYIAKVYKSSMASKLCQAWVNEHLVNGKLTVSREVVICGFEEILDKLPNSEIKKLSKHFDGNAFDIQPIKNGEEIKKFIRTLPELNKFIEKENGLTIWHAQFNK